MRAMTPASWRAYAGVKRDTACCRTAWRPGGTRTLVIKVGRTDYERMAARYDAGRALPHEWIQEWHNVLAPYVAGSRLPFVDLGSGTGIWSQALATWFCVPVIGIEPSEAMRSRAKDKGLPSQVCLVGGDAGRIPLKSGSCSHAWLSTVIHHIHDLRAAARELRRVLDDDGAVLIRNSFGDRLEGPQWLRYFPSARKLAGLRWPTVEATADAFRTAGFELDSLHRVSEVAAEDMSAYVERLRERANSTLALIGDEEFAVGLARLEDAARRAPRSQRVVDQRDLLVLR
jgi:ubiquinone/menaquinone biosynthesis C-methylase UbiE